MDAIEDGNGNVAKCEYHPLAINPGFPVEVSKTNKQAYSDYGQNWSPKPDRVGLSGPFSYAPSYKISIKKESVTLLFFNHSISKLIIDKLVSIRCHDRRAR